MGVGAVQTTEDKDYNGEERAGVALAEVGVSIRIKKMLTADIFCICTMRASIKAVRG